MGSALMLCYWRGLKSHAPQNLVLMASSWAFSFEGYFEAVPPLGQPVMKTSFALTAEFDICLVL